MDRKDMNIPFSLPTLGKEEEKAVLRVMRSGWLAAGLETEAFEKEFCKYIGAKHCIFTNSCTAALKLGNKYFKEQGINRILYPRNTFCATYSAAEEVGLRTVAFDDVFTIGKNDLLTVVHFGGKIDKRYKLNLVGLEDSAHRIEANDPLVGKIRCYSFYVTKNMTCNGRGGMLATNDKDIYERCRLFWRDGISTTTKDRQDGKWDYKVEAMSSGYDGIDVEAAVGRVQLKKLPEFTRRRNEIRDKYNQAFGTNWQGNHLFCIEMETIPRLKRFLEYMKSNEVMCGWHYPNTGWTMASLPIYPLLKDEEQEFIIEKVRGFNGKL